MADLGNRANVNSAIDLLLDDLQPDEAIQPSDHNVLLKDILDTLANGLSTVLRTGNTTDGQNLTITSSSIFQFSNGSNGRLQSDTLTAFRNWTLPDTTGTIALLSDIPISDSIYTASGTIPSSVVATITDSLTLGHLNIDQSIFGTYSVIGTTTKNSSTGYNIAIHEPTGQMTFNVPSGTNMHFDVANSIKGKLLSNGSWVFGGVSLIGSEKISLQGSTAVQGAGTSTGSALSIYDNDTTPNKLWDFLDNGKLNASNLPTISTGTVVGDVWSQNGTVKIGNPSANITTVASVGGLTVNADTTEVAKVLALATNITINAPTGTPNDNQSLWFRILDNGTSRTITLNAVFEDYTGNFPTSTTAGKYLIFAGKWNADEGKWNILAWKVQP